MVDAEFARAGVGETELAEEAIEARGMECAKAVALDLAEGARDGFVGGGVHGPIDGKSSRLACIDVFEEKSTATTLQFHRLRELKDHWRPIRKLPSQPETETPVFVLNLSSL